MKKDKGVDFTNDLEAMRYLLGKGLEREAGLKKTIEWQNKIIAQFSMRPFIYLVVSEDRVLGEYKNLDNASRKAESHLKRTGSACLVYAAEGVTKVENEVTFTTLEIGK